RSSRRGTQQLQRRLRGVRGHPEAPGRRAGGMSAPDAAVALRAPHRRLPSAQLLRRDPERRSRRARPPDAGAAGDDRGPHGAGDVNLATQSTISRWGEEPGNGWAPLLFVVANKLPTAANTIFLQYTAPLYVMLAGPWLLDEPVRPRDIAFFVVVAASL